MQIDHCPICNSELVNRDVAPCWDCGHDPTEIDHLDNDKHEYFEYAFLGVPIVLCDYCVVDFSSYDPKFFGLTNSKRIGLGTESFNLIRKIDNPSITKDKYCPTCSHRLHFLNWLYLIRNNNQQETS